MESASGLQPPPEHGQGSERQRDSGYCFRPELSEPLTCLLLLNSTQVSQLPWISDQSLHLAPEPAKSGPELLS